MVRRFLPRDSLRGIAAVAIVIMHTRYMAKWPWITAHWAVMLFFVLSGFVLAQPWAIGSSPPTLTFLMRRLCRLWPPVIVAVIISAALTVATEGRSAVDGATIIYCVLPSVHGGNCSLDGALIALSLNVDKLAILNPNQATMLIAPALGLICIPADTARGCGFALLIAAAIRSTRFSKAIMHVRLPWLGRVSYSLYLIHAPVVAFAFNEIGHANAKTAAAVGIAVALGLAEIMPRLVEQPSIRLGGG
jgi:peptidoglycan/LPS O-acetylase OafA/YrhL